MPSKQRNDCIEVCQTHSLFQESSKPRYSTLAYRYLPRYLGLTGYLHKETVIEARVARAEFENWIEAELAAIEACVDQVLAAANVHARDIDQVFLTGGSSFVPAVRRIFDTRFGRDRISTGNEFISVASGLALAGHS